MFFKKKKKHSSIGDAGREKNDPLRILNENTSFDVRESFNELRTNILFSISDKGTRKILITSSLAAEGKSTTALNVAISLAEVDEKVLIIDCDLRRPNLGRLLSDKEKKGLSNILVNDCSISDALHSTKYKNLDIILTGATPPNPTELLSSDNMRSFVDEVSANYDYVIFDTPPINLVTDAAIISRLASGVIIVARQYVTEKKLLTAAIEKLNFVDAKILGVVLNDVVAAKSGYGKYSYGGYYRHYGAYAKAAQKNEN